MWFPVEKYEDVLDGSLVLLKDNRVVTVTDVADQDPGAYTTWEDEGGAVKMHSTQPRETIFVGYIDSPERIIVSDMSEIIGIWK